MTWQDRINEASYTSPSGERFLLPYDDVSRSKDKKTTGFESPGFNGTFVQSTGTTGFRYPFSVPFSGPDCDLQASQFEEALYQEGIGRLDHPVYGSVDVVPFGTIDRIDNLKTGANVATVNVVFWETTGASIQGSESDQRSNVFSAIDDYNISAAETFSESVDIDTAIERVTLKSRYESVLDSVNSGLGSIASTNDSVKKQFDIVYDSVKLGLDVLVNDPITLAFQTIKLIQIPGNAVTSISESLKAYEDLSKLIIDQIPYTPGNDSRVSNSFHSDDLYSSTYVTGSILSSLDAEFKTKSEALEAADNIINQFNQVVVWRDDNYESLGQIDTSDSYQKLQEAVAAAAGFLVQLSFSLKAERSVILDRNRTIIDLSAELYGSVSDDTINFLINTNDLSGSEIREINRGREILYYR